jgi:hypothetical protein
MSGGFAPVTLTISVRSGERLQSARLDTTSPERPRQPADLDLESPRRAPGDPIADGASSSEAVAQGTAHMTMTSTTLPGLAELLQGWMRLDAGRSVKIHATANGQSFDLEYASGSASEEELKRLIEAVSRSR